MKSILIGSHAPVIEDNKEKLWFVVCGDNDFIGYWSEDKFMEGLGWNANEVSEILAMEKGETLQYYSSSMHTLVCVK
jgi:hypothetical protein